MIAPNDKASEAFSEAVRKRFFARTTTWPSRGFSPVARSTPGDKLTFEDFSRPSHATTCPTHPPRLLPRLLPSARPLTLLLSAALLAGCAMPTAVAPSAAATAQAAVPDYSQTGPLGAAMEGWAYPYPVQMLQFEHEGRLLRMAYMDVQPAKPNGQTVMLFHGKNFGADYWASTLQALSAQGYRVIAPDMSTMSPASVLAQVISTHGTPAYVHLALESQRRFCPDVAVLVVDDCSADGDPLTALCANHGVPLVRNPRVLATRTATWPPWRTACGLPVTARPTGCSKHRVASFL